MEALYSLSPFLVGGAIYLILLLGRWKVWLAYVAASVAISAWLLWLISSSDDPAAADGLTVLFAVSGILFGVVLIRFVFLSISK
jgi:hypothetical protein